MKANYVGIGGLVFSDGKILDYYQLLPLFNEMEEKIEILEHYLPKLSAEESDRIFNEIQKRLHENCDGAPDGGHADDCKSR